MDENGKGGAGAGAGGGVRQLNLGTLGALRGGVVGERFDAELERVLADCRDRPTNETARKIVVQIELVPVVGEITRDNPELNKIDIVVQVKSTVPPHMVNAHQARLRSVRRRDGQEGLMAVVGGDPDDADQMTFNG